MIRFPFAHASRRRHPLRGWLAAAALVAHAAWPGHARPAAFRTGAGGHRHPSVGGAGAGVGVEAAGAAASRGGAL